MNAECPDRYLRLRKNATFRDGAFERWQRACIAVIGCGALGSRIAPEIVRSGARAWLCDLEDDVEPHNLATQALQAGLSKVDGVLRSCAEIRPGAASGVCADIRHVGIGVLRRCALLIDCTDDGRLAYPLTEIANGLRRPLLRVAVDGTGQWELGRVLCSDPRDAGSCQLCTHTFDDLAKDVPRIHCPEAQAAGRPATHAGNALANVMTGIAVLQAQRIVTGNDLALVRNREIIVDLNHFEIMAATVRRSPACISGHAAWELVDVAAATTPLLGDVYREASRLVDSEQVRLEPHGHPWCLQASCACGACCAAVGTVWATPPTCPDCGSTMTWDTASQVASLLHSQAAELGLLDRLVGELGLPETGAMFMAQSEGRQPVRMVLNNT